MKSDGLETHPVKYCSKRGDLFCCDSYIYFPEVTGNRVAPSHRLQTTDLVYSGFSRNNVLSAAVGFTLYAFMRKFQFSGNLKTGKHRFFCKFSM